jgi:general secretion pathway protein D
MQPHRPSKFATYFVAACALLTGATGLFPLNSLAQTADAALKRGQPVTLNFTNAEIEAVARAMATLTGRNVVVDPRVKGTITLNTDSPVSPAMAYYQFRTLLRLQGYTVVQGDDLDRVLPEADAKLQSGVVGVSESGGKTASGNQLMTQIIRLQHENANNLVTILRPLISPNNTINVNPGTNALVITDYADNLRRLARIVEALDVANATGLEVVPLKHASRRHLQNHGAGRATLERAHRARRQPGAPGAGLVPHRQTRPARRQQRQWRRGQYLRGLPEKRQRRAARAHAARGAQR